jgi:hypothetical protein
MRPLYHLVALVAAASLFFPAGSVPAASDDLLKQVKEELKTLQKRMDKLRQIIERQEKELQAVKEKQAAAPVKAAVAPPQETSTLTGISRKLNPAISVNGLFLGAATANRRAGDQEPGLFIQEAELRAAAFVDPNVKGDMTIAVEQGKDGEFEFDLEELFFDIFGIPSALLPEGAKNQIEGVSLRVGKSFVPFGKHNPLHTHQFPFINPPLVNERVFGDEGLNEVLGLVNVSLPTPVFFEVQGAVMEGRNEVLFDSPRSPDLAGFVRGHTLFDVTDDTTAEVGTSFAWGENADLLGNQVLGGDLTVKSVRGQTQWPHQVIWTTEYIYHKLGEPGRMAALHRGGLYSGLQVQVHRNWWVQGRYDIFGIPQFDGAFKEHRLTGLVALVPNEFSAIRLQYSFIDDETPGVKDAHEVLVQFNYTFGSHPAHLY